MIKFPRRRHARASRDGVEGVAFDLAADLLIDQRRGENRRTTIRRQKRNPGAGARVERVRLLEQPRDDRAKPFVETGFGEPRVRVDSRFPQPLPWQIDSAETRILADIAGDVGELHRDPKIAGAGERLRRSHVHDQRHHHADRAGDARCIVEEFVDRFVASAFRIPGKPLEQGLGQGGGNGASAHEIGHCAIRRVRLGTPPRGADEAVAQSVQRVLGAAAEVDRIIRQAAKGVEREGPLARLCGQEPRGGVKRP